MDSDRRSRISDLYHAALERAPEERSAFVRAESDGDETLRQEVESLLACEPATARFLERPAVAVVGSGFGRGDLVGRELGPYKIVAPLGAGGMGDVYRARDSKLGRDVAIKMLPPHFMADPERRARFAREARLLATLNHPHIGAIYGLEHVGEISALVLELVEGPTLAGRLERGPLPVAQALTMARQIAEALDAAHQKGIIHRDLKPANIVLQGFREGSTEGAVKVLDFGLAKATGAPGAAQLDMPTSPSSALMTEQGVILGTAAYMSPEQAKGHTADTRSDVWAFGCVVYEMLAGRRPFGGEDTSATLASVLRDEPDWQALPEAARPLASVLKRLLEKDPAGRLRDMGDVKLLMSDAERDGAPVAAVAARRPWWLVGAAMLGVAAGVVSAALVVSWRRPVPRIEQFVLGSVAMAPSTDPSGRNLVISPDGTHVVYTTGSQPREQLVVQAIGRLEGTIIAGDRSRDPFFSADGRQIYYATLKELRRVSVGGGSSFKVCDLSVVFGGGSWGPDNSIVFAQSGGLGLFRVPASGGEPARIAAPDTSKDEVDYFRPVVLPDGLAVLYTVALKTGQTRIVARRFAGGDPITVVESGFGAVYLASGHLLYAQDQRLMAVTFDSATLHTTGAPVPVQERVSTKGAGRVANVAASRDGTVVYIPAESPGLQHIVWVDRGGTATRAFEQALEFPRHLRLSPDGERLAITVGRPEEGQVWVHYLRDASRPPVKLTREDHNVFPIWSPNGKRILFSTRGDTNALNVVDADKSLPEPDTLVRDSGLIWPMAWVRRQTDVVLVSPRRDGKHQDLELFQMTDRRWREWPRTRIDGVEARVSADGKWVAYTSNRSGQSEIWVRSFPEGGNPQQISREGGRDPVWSANEGELFYRNGSKMMAVKVAAGVPAESPRELFDKEFVSSQRGFDVARDGRFLMITADTPDPPASIVLLRGLVLPR